MRALSCRALVGLARHEPIRQILSQLPLIVNNEIAGEDFFGIIFAK